MLFPANLLASGTEKIKIRTWRKHNIINLS